MRFILFFALLCCSGLIALPLFKVASSYFWLEQLLHFQFQYFLLANILACICFVYFKRTSLVTLAAIYTLFLTQNHTWFFNTPNHSASPYLSVAQANLRYYNPMLPEALSTLSQLDADLYLLFEVNQNKKAQFIDFAKDYYRFGDADIDGFPSGMGIVSKYPILNVKKHPVLNQKGIVLSFTIQTPTQPLQVLMMHPPSARSVDKWQHRNMILGNAGLLVEQLTHSNGLVLVAGDFNTTPWSAHFPTHHSLSACYEQSGYFTSWHPHTKLQDLGWFAGIAIDHCLLSQPLELAWLETIRLAGSDHLGLFYDISMKSP